MTMVSRSCRGSVLRLASDDANRVAELLVFVIGFGMALLTGAQVFSRYLLNHSLFWSEEVGRMALVWITFIGGSAAYKRHYHAGVDFLVARLPYAGRRACRAMALCLGLLFFSVMVVYGVIFARFVVGQQTPALGIPVALPYLAIPAGGALFFLHGLSELVELILADRGEP